MSLIFDFSFCLDGLEVLTLISGSEFFTHIFGSLEKTELKNNVTLWSLMMVVNM